MNLITGALWIGMVMTVYHSVVYAAAPVPAPHIAPLQECVSCHRTRDTVLVTRWQNSRHGQAGLSCPACHGTVHAGKMAATARRNDQCTGCHPKETGSYLRSKHGVIATLEAGKTDFSRPLKDGNQRAPTCAYCHLHDGGHDAGVGIFPLAPMGRVPSPDDATRAEQRDTPCRDCHSPRFVATWFITGDRMVEIGRMKVREADSVVAKIDSQQARNMFHRMQNEHLRNVRLGVGHQSPDDQWWHGHPALDSDLLHLKSLLGDLLRQLPPPPGTNP